MNKVDRELAQAEARRGETEQGMDVQVAPRSKLREAMKRWAKDRVVRRTSTKR